MTAGVPAADLGTYSGPDRSGERQWWPTLGSGLRVTPRALLTASLGTLFAGYRRPVDASPTTVRAPPSWTWQMPKGPRGDSASVARGWGRGPWSRSLVQALRRLRSTAVGRGHLLDPSCQPHPTLLCVWKELGGGDGLEPLGSLGSDMQGVWPVGWPSGGWTPATASAPLSRASSLVRTRPSLCWYRLPPRPDWPRPPVPFWMTAPRFHSRKLRWRRNSFCPNIARWSVTERGRGWAGASEQEPLKSAMELWSQIHLSMVDACGLELDEQDPGGWRRAPGS